MTIYVNPDMKCPYCNVLITIYCEDNCGTYTCYLCGIDFYEDAGVVIFGHCRECNLYQNRSNQPDTLQDNKGDDFSELSHLVHNILDTAGPLPYRLQPLRRAAADGSAENSDIKYNDFDFKIDENDTKVRIDTYQDNRKDNIQYRDINDSDRGIINRIAPIDFSSVHTQNITGLETIQGRPMNNPVLLDYHNTARSDELENKNTTMQAAIELRDMLMNILTNRSADTNAWINNIDRTLQPVVYDDDDNDDDEMPELVSSDSF